MSQANTYQEVRKQLSNLRLIGGYLCCPFLIGFMTYVAADSHYGLSAMIALVMSIKCPNDAKGNVSVIQEHESKAMAG